VIAVIIAKFIGFVAMFAWSLFCAASYDPRTRTVEGQLEALTRAVNALQRTIDAPRQLRIEQERAAFLGKKPGDIDWPTESGLPG